MKNTSPASTLANCSFVKTVLMLCVILGHCCNFWTGTWFTKDPVIASSFLPILSGFFSSFHVYGFALVSGYLFYFVKYERATGSVTYQKYLPFLKGKALRLLVPYAFVSVLWVIPISLCFMDLSVKEIIVNYVLAKAPAQLWFLFMLFTLFALIFPISDLLKKNTVLAVVISLSAYAVSLVVPIPNYFQIVRALEFVPFFVLGFKWRQLRFDFLQKIPSVVFILIQILLFSAYRILPKGSLILNLAHYGLNFSMNVWGAIASFVVLDRLAQKIRWQERPVLKKLSRYSMPVYLLHQELIYVVIFFLNGKIHPVLHASLNFVVAFSVSLLISMLLMKCKFGRFILGEK